ncbi:MAG: FAD-dependent oxidoreductase [Chloroflexi bacterium]|nr:FAD-dependent oxidoreductase [Chloroflexota bacterium]
MPRDAEGSRYFYQSAPELPGGAVDVLVIGGAAAACFAALEAAKAGLQVLMLDKGIVGRSGSTPTSGSAPAVCFPQYVSPSNPESDSLERFFEDLRATGELVNDPRLVRVFVDEAPRRVLDTANMGVRYVRTPDGRFRQHATMGHTRPRTLTPIGRSRSVLGTLRRELLHRGVRIVERTAAVRLLVEDGQVAGVVGLDVLTGQVRVFPARAVVVAGGSATALFPYQSASFLTTGDAWVLGYEAGARLANVEFMEFTLIPKLGRTIIPSGGISPYLTFGGKLYDRHGERILKRYDPERMEGASRGTIVYAVYSEMQAGRGPITNEPADFNEAQWHEVPDITQRLDALGHDYRNEQFEWVPALHTCLGGMLVDAEAWTGVPGLWAAGESASTIHGANRLSSCAIPDCYVFGARAGRAAARHALRTYQPGPAAPGQAAREAEALRAHFSTNGEQPADLYQRIREVAWSSLGLSRDAAGLHNALAEIDALRRVPVAVADTASLVKAVEVRSLLQTAEFVARAAQARTESRGQHHRTDFPARDDERWLRWVVLQRSEQGVQVSAAPIPSPEPALQD